LDSADITEGKVPFYTPKSRVGIIRGNRIYFRTGGYDASRISGLALLGHELFHVGQYRQGMNWLKYILRPNKYEKPAEDKQAEISGDMTAKKIDPCPK
jgi:Domain of unknown function (DUF4157)